MSEMEKYKNLAIDHNFLFTVKFNYLNQFEATIIKDSKKYWSMHETAAGALMGAWLQLHANN